MDVFPGVSPFALSRYVLCSADILGVRRPAQCPSRRPRVAWSYYSPARMIRTAFLLVRDLLHFVVLVCSSHHRPQPKTSSFASKLASYVERIGQAAAPERCHQNRPRPARAGHRLATAPCRRAPGLARAVAPAGIPPVRGWKSRRPGRPQIPVSLQDLIADMARANRTWGEERIAELLL
jgi:hypothetical protein